MTVEVANGVAEKINMTAASKKSRESERRRRRRKQKKNKKASESTAGDDSDTAAENGNGVDDSAKENSDPQKDLEPVDVEYVPEKADFYGDVDEEFRKVFEKFCFKETAGSEDNDKKDETAPDAALKKNVNSDSDEEEQDATQKEKSISNKKKKAYIEKEDSKKLKQKQRERMQPKMGKMDIDYQVLHDAFFKYQTKPKLTAHGDMYHEGKEFEVKLREMKPGMLSQELKDALGMPEGTPPPWLINMQRYGPPPSYPQLKIPGLNAPIPPGASFGYHPGGWGKPPVDENGRPLYGDVFGEYQQEQPNYEEEPVDKSKHWDSLSRYVAALIASSIIVLSTPTGVETPDVIDLRKQQRKEPEKPLYQVLDEKEEKIAPGTLLGTSHTYVIGSGTQDKTGAKRVDLLKGQKTDRVDVTLAPEELELMDNVLPAKYEEAREEEKLRSQREDFSDMVAENEKKRKRKMQDKEGKSKKKDFKYEEAREEEKLRSQREDFSDMVAENEKKRKRKMQDKEGKSKKKDFKF
ncbi:unnamed protein product [Ilex paraguariensis]|uniref:PSP proline-rich domain-containing protein n=1 Tax=Ilex paraguariensis TaxID=185542 RepID=A0ABC8ULM9_9AQUA